MACADFVECDLVRIEEAPQRRDASAHALDLQRRPDLGQWGVTFGSGDREDPRAVPPKAVRAPVAIKGASCASP